MIYVGQERINPENGRSIIITEVDCTAKSDGAKFVRYRYSQNEGDWAGAESWATYEDMSERFSHERT